MKRLTALFAALIIITTMAPAAAQDDDTVESGPLGSRAMTSDLKDAGHRNGRLTDGVLLEVSGGTNERCRVEADAAVAWQVLVLAAEADGVTGFAAGWCYRSLAQQERTYARNCGWVYDPAPPAVEGEEPPPPPAKHWVCNPPTARPGTSNHGWGRAIDVVDTTTSKAHILKCSDPQFAWLRDNGARYGWVLPSWARCGSRTQEPWHFEWAGLTIPISQLIIGAREARGAEVPH
jgi:LAS superfamily LD-carboxypeptidase LdcB